MPTAPQRRDTLAVLFALVFPCFMAWLYFVQLAQTGVRNNPALQIAFGVGKAIQFLFPVLYVWWFERDRLVLRWPTRQGLALAPASACSWPGRSWASTFSGSSTVLFWATRRSASIARSGNSIWRPPLATCRWASSSA